MKPTHVRLPAFVALALLLVAPGFAQTTFSDSFNSSSSFSSSYSSGGFNAFNWSSSAGIGGGGGVTFSGSTNSGTATLSSSVASFANTAGETNTVSVFFRASQYSSKTDSSRHVVVQVGFEDAASSTNKARLDWTTYNNPQLKFLGPGVSFGLTGYQGSGAVDLTANNWYRLELSLVKSSTANTFSFTGKLEDWGSGGTSLVSTVYSATNGLTSGNLSGLYNATTLVPFITGSVNMETSTTFSMDSLSVSGASAIPEPSTYALWMGIAALGGIVYWRRRSGQPRPPAAPAT